MKDDGDITILADYTTAGGWNVLPDFAPPIITEPVGDKAIRYWQDLACANRKVAEDNQNRRIAAEAQRDKAREDALEEAAKVCEELRHPNWSEEDHAWIMGTEACAGAIRAMKVEK